jgi:ABC-type proline/glycine betaine transport system permease subunit
VLLAWPRPLAGLLAAGSTTATLGALLISLGAGLFGFRESTAASYVTETLAIETITALALLSWTILVTATPAGRATRARGRHPPRARPGSRQRFACSARPSLIIPSPDRNCQPLIY